MCEKIDFHPAVEKTNQSSRPQILARLCYGFRKNRGKGKETRNSYLIIVFFEKERRGSEVRNPPFPFMSRYRPITWNVHVKRISCISVIIASDVLGKSSNAFLCSSPGSHARQSTRLVRDNATRLISSRQVGKLVPSVYNTDTSALLLTIYRRRRYYY